MHTVNLSNWARPCACCAAVGMPPLGSRFRHVLSAAWNCGDWETVPPTKIVPPELGSGKLTTPWERMHWAYLSMSAPLPPLMTMTACGPPPGAPLPAFVAPPPPPPAPAEGDSVVVVVEPTLATLGDAEPPPQAAKRRAEATSTSPAPAPCSLLVRAACITFNPATFSSGSYPRLELPVRAPELCLSRLAGFGAFSSIPSVRALRGIRQRLVALEKTIDGALSPVRCLVSHHDDMQSFG